MWSLLLVVPLLARASELHRGSGGRLAHVGKRAARARGAHPPPSAPPWDRTRLLRGSWALGASGLRSRLARPSAAAWPGSQPPPPREPPGRGRGGEGVCGAGGEGAERCGRERRSQRASERGISAQLLSASEPARAATDRKNRETDRQTAPGRRAATTRLAGRGERAGWRRVPSLEYWRTCVAGAASFDSCLCRYVCRGPSHRACVECERACVSVDRYKWMFGVYARVHLCKGVSLGAGWCVNLGEGLCVCLCLSADVPGEGVSQCVAVCTSG